MVVDIKQSEMWQTTKARQNRYAEFRLAAETVASKIRTLEGVTGIVFLGGLTRGFTDDDSDVDITVFVDADDENLNRSLRRIVEEAQNSSGLEIDFEIHVVREFARREWSEIDRWELGKAEIVFDPRGVLSSIFRKGLGVPDDFWTTRIVKCSTYLRWYCCPHAGQKCVAETWIERGDVLSSHYCVNYSFDLILELTFALNREFLPPPKWRIQYARDLRWLPRDFEGYIEEMALVNSFSESDVKRRLDAAMRIWPGLLDKVQKETGLNTDTIARYYVEKTLGQK